MRALIVANGAPVSIYFLRRLCESADLIILTDGAANQWDPAIAVPNAVLGDFDSITNEALSQVPTLTRIDAFNQESSDLEKAVQHAIDKGAASVTISQWEGDRQDHQLGAVSLLLKFRSRADIQLATPESYMYAFSGSGKIAGKVGDRLSLISLGHSPVITLAGVKYPLNCEMITPGTRGLSNELTAESAPIEVTDGVVIVCHFTGQP
ncbi:MAG: thiamine diphosphokinase [Chthonomonadales bacterium]